MNEPSRGALSCDAGGQVTVTLPCIHPAELIGPSHPLGPNPQGSMHCHGKTPVWLIVKSTTSTDWAGEGMFMPSCGIVNVWDTWPWASRELTTL